MRRPRRRAGRRPDRPRSRGRALPQRPALRSERASSRGRALPQRPALRGGRASSRGRALVRGERGQALVEAIALIPLVLVVALGLMQLLAVGYAGVLSGQAAEAGALALASGGDARAAAERALPDWPGDRHRVSVDGGRIEVLLRPPSPLRTLAQALEVRATAAVEAP